MTEIVTSSYESAWLYQRGHTFIAVPKPGRRDDCVYEFRTSKRLAADRAAYLEDVDLQEFVLAHRQVKQAVKAHIKGQRTDSATLRYRNPRDQK